MRPLPLTLRDKVDGDAIMARNRFCAPLLRSVSSFDLVLAKLVIRQILSACENIVLHTVYNLHNTIKQFAILELP